MFLLTTQKPNMSSEIKILCKNFYAKQILVGISFNSEDQSKRFRNAQVATFPN